MHVSLERRQIFNRVVIIIISVFDKWKNGFSSSEERRLTRDRAYDTSEVGRARERSKKKKNRSRPSKRHPRFAFVPDCVVCVSFVVYSPWPPFWFIFSLIIIIICFHRAALNVF